MARHFHGLELLLRQFSGARAVRVVHSGGQTIDEHHHDWPSLTLPVTGGCLELFDGGSVGLSGPCAAFHPPRCVHSDRIDEAGMETVSLQFDPDWLREPGLLSRFDRSVCFTGGSVGRAAVLLAATWSDATQSEAALRTATADFLRVAAVADQPLAPPWIALVDRTLAASSPPSTAQIARMIDRNPAWLARSYRLHRGEGLAETLRRRRVERATFLLRKSDLSPSQIAVEAGFCDQSHMNRCVRHLLGRTPLAIRAERAMLAGLAEAQAGNAEPR